jgi:Ca2+:H+ antiporter
MKLSLRPSFNWLFAFVPITVALEHVGGFPAPLVFFAAALAIVPIASLLVHATEQIATRTGDAVGGLLNATFGNAPELIIAVVALHAGLLDMVRASLIGAILANLLLALGIAFLLGGMRFHDQDYNPTAARVYSSMMLIAVISLGVPSAFSRFFSPEETIRQEMPFGRAEIGSVFMAVLIGAIVAGDGRSNWYKGVQLITVYIVIALMFYLLPDTAVSPR